MPKSLLKMPQTVYLIRTGETPNRRLMLVYIDVDGTPVPLVEAVY